MAAKRLSIPGCSSRLIVLLVWLTVGLTGVLQPGESGVSLPRQKRVSHLLSNMSAAAPWA